MGLEQQLDGRPVDGRDLAELEHHRPGAPVRLGGVVIRVGVGVATSATTGAAATRTAGRGAERRLTLGATDTARSVCAPSGADDAGGVCGAEVDSSGASGVGTGTAVELAGVVAAFFGAASFAGRVVGTVRTTFVRVSSRPGGGSSGAGSGEPPAARAEAASPSPSASTIAPTPATSTGRRKDDSQ